jgi:hypothetical protein
LKRRNVNATYVEKRVKESIILLYKNGHASLNVNVARPVLDGIIGSGSLDFYYPNFYQRNLKSIIFTYNLKT